MATAMGTSIDIERSKLAGADAHITKPVTIAKIISTM